MSSRKKLPARVAHAIGLDAGNDSTAEAPDDGHRIELHGAPHDFSRDRSIPPDAIAAAGLRNGMVPQQVHDALHAVWKARGERF